jgi:hypothetical protein
MEYLGLLFELLLFALGVYVYLFSRGFVRSGNTAVQERAEQFRKRNGWWLRIGGLALMALMGANIYMHLRDLLHT